MLLSENKKQTTGTNYLEILIRLLSWKKKKIKTDHQMSQYIP